MKEGKKYMASLSMSAHVAGGFVPTMFTAPSSAASTHCGTLSNANLSSCSTSSSGSLASSTMSGTKLPLTGLVRPVGKPAGRGREVIVMTATISQKFR